MIYQHSQALDSRFLGLMSRMQDTLNWQKSNHGSRIVESLNGIRPVIGVKIKLLAAESGANPPIHLQLDYYV